VLCVQCFQRYKSLISVTFECDSFWQRMEDSRYADSDFTKLYIPASVEVLNNRYFYECELLLSVTLELSSKLRRVASDSFQQSICHIQIVFLPFPSGSFWVAVQCGVCSVFQLIIDKEWLFRQNSSRSHESGILDGKVSSQHSLQFLMLVVGLTSSLDNS
jgi:hypothetical protein